MHSPVIDWRRQNPFWNGTAIKFPDSDRINCWKSSNISSMIANCIRRDDCCLRKSETWNSFSRFSVPFFVLCIYYICSLRFSEKPPRCTELCSILYNKLYNYPFQTCCRTTRYIILEFPFFFSNYICFTRVFGCGKCNFYKSVPYK